MGILPVNKFKINFMNFNNKYTDLVLKYKLNKLLKQDFKIVILYRIIKKFWGVKTKLNLLKITIDNTSYIHYSVPK